MHIVLEIIFGVLLLGVVVFGIIVTAVFRLLKGSTKDTNETQQDEARMIQEMYKGFEKMEQRIESLETILMDYEANKEKTK